MRTTFGGRQAQAELAIIIAAAMLIPMPRRFMVIFNPSPSETHTRSRAYIRVARWIKHTVPSSCMQKTRFLDIIGPATESYEMLQKLYDAGMSITRLNMSHGDHESHAKVVQHIETLNRKVKFPIPILLDTQGPEIRTWDLSNELNLRQGISSPSRRVGR